MEKTYKLQEYLEKNGIYEYGILNEKISRPVKNEVLQPFLSKGMICKGYKSLIIIAYPYSTNVSRAIGLYGDISLSQTGIDYHITVKSLLEGVADFIKEGFGGNSTTFVDISPFDEKSLAHRAGVGRFSKNTTIITEKYGSRVNLGIIASDILFTPIDVSQNTLALVQNHDAGACFEPTNSSFGARQIKRIQRDYCDGCNKCVAACPTGALNGKYGMNHSRCLSYITQYKGDIPTYAFNKIGRTIFGCDICQSVCPYNKKQGEAVHSYTQIDISSLFYMSNKEFKMEYEKSAFSWRGKNILLRNSIVALSNMADDDSFMLLNKAKEDSRDFVRHYARICSIRREKKSGILEF